MLLLLWRCYHWVNTTSKNKINGEGTAIHSQWSFVDFYFQLKQNQIMLFCFTVFVELESRPRVICFKTDFISHYAGHWKRVKKIDAPEFSDCYPEPCRRILSTFFLLSTVSSSSSCILCLWSSSQIFVVLDIKTTWQGIDLGLLLNAANMCCKWGLFQRFHCRSHFLPLFMTLFMTLFYFEILKN